MNILLIGNFSLPCDEEGLHNFTLLEHHRKNGDNCKVINISDIPSDETNIVNARSFVKFVPVLLRHSIGAKVVHFLSKGYVRPGLMKLITAVLFGRLFGARIILSIHSELFSVFGRLRSKGGGQQILRVAFRIAYRVICSDEETFRVAAIHKKTTENFVILPFFGEIPPLEDDEDLFPSEFLERNKTILALLYPERDSFLTESLKNSINELQSRQIGIVVLSTDERTIKAIREEFPNGGENILCIRTRDRAKIAHVFTKSHIIARHLACDGQTLFIDNAFLIERPVCRDGLFLNATGATIIKKGDTASFTLPFNEIMNISLPEGPEWSLADFYREIRGNIYGD